MDLIPTWGRHAHVFKGTLARPLEISCGVACPREIRSVAILIWLKYFVG